MPQEKDGRIELLRFIFAVLMMILHSHRIGYPGGHPFPQGYAFVEFYFYLSGYYLVCHALRNPDDTAVGYTFRKFARIIPYTAVCVFLYFIFAVIQLFIQGEASFSSLLRLAGSLPFEMLLIQASGSHGVILLSSLWYLSILFCVFPIVSYVVFKYRDGIGRIMMISVPIFVYGYMCVQYGNVNGDVIVDWDSWNGVVMMFIRAVGGLFAGCGMYYASKEMERLNKIPGKQVFTDIAAVLLLFAAIILGCFFELRGPSIFLIFMFLWFALCLIFSNPPGKKAFCSNFCILLGKLSLPLYVCHMLVGDVIQTFLGYLSIWYKMPIYIVACLVFSYTLLYAVTAIFKAAKKLKREYL